MLADHCAKIAAQRNNLCAADLKSFTDARKLYKQVALNMLQILVHWPPLKPLYGTLSRTQGARVDPPLPRPHSPVWDGYQWRCQQCHRIGARQLRNSKCVEFAPSVAALINRAAAPDYPHSLWVGQQETSGIPVVFCGRCGHMATARAVKLTGPCHPSGSSQKDLKKLWKGVLPGGNGQRITQPWPIHALPSAPQALTPPPSRLLRALKAGGT